MILYEIEKRLKRDLDNKTIVTSNIIWRFLERVLAQLVGFVVSIIIARILNPEIYGTVALITVFTRILQVFVDSGLGNSLIQKKDADDIDFSTVFYTNLIFCFFLYCLIFIVAPIISSFYGDQMMTPYIRVLGLTVLISGIKNVQQAYVSKHMLFRKFFFSTLGGTVVAGIIGMYMAFNGAGVWALIAQQVINLLIDTIILWITVKWRPVKKFSFARLKKLYSFGWKLLVSALLDTGYNEIRQLLIGKFYTSSDLAFYNQGERFPKVIIENIDASIDSVLLPTMSREQDDREHIKMMVRRSIQVSTYIMAPLMIGLIFISEPLVRVLLTYKWLPAVFFLRIFCISFLFYPIHTANLNAINAVGRSDLFLKLEIAKKTVGLILLIITINISVKAMAYSVLISTFTSQIINSWPNKKLLGYRYVEQMKDILPNLIMAFIMGVTVYIIGVVNCTDILRIIIQIIVGVIFYLICSALFKNESYIYLMTIVKDYFLMMKKRS
ncbi:MAG: lipopolysaccharide biosynthesis protein [Lachnospiraceae bacterium]|jgi:O-antigen/teichoic acid export membrane protein|nr:lipopolysaccharide biosynthesis protein [Lachnospiraceae bacterium]